MQVKQLRAKQKGVISTSREVCWRRRFDQLVYCFIWLS